MDALDEAVKAEFKEVKRRQDELLPQIEEKVFAYGSSDAIKILIKFENMICNQSDGQIKIEAYYLLPLLMAQVKANVTGEFVNLIKAGLRDYMRKMELCFCGK